MTRHYLLDASALLALIRNEAGADRVQGVLDDSEIHAVNLADVIRKLISKGMPAEEVRTLLDDLKLDVITEISQEQAYVTGELAAQNQHLGLSLGDCVCLTLAGARHATAVTADRCWLEVKNANTRLLQVRD